MRHQSWHRRGLLVILAVFAFVIVSGTMLSSFHWIHKPFPGFFLHENLTVGPYFLPHWSGGVAGLQSLDVIVKIDGNPVSGRAELYDRVQKLPVGTRFDLYDRPAFEHLGIDHSQYDVHLAGLVFKFRGLRFHWARFLCDRCGALLFSSQLAGSFAAFFHGDRCLRLVREHL